MGLETVRPSKSVHVVGRERRRPGNCASLTLEPSFILLDEPFSASIPLTGKGPAGDHSDLAQSGIAC